MDCPGSRGLSRLNESRGEGDRRARGKFGNVHVGDQGSVLMRMLNKLRRADRRNHGAKIEDDWRVVHSKVEDESVGRKCCEQDFWAYSKQHAFASEGQPHLAKVKCAIVRLGR